MSPKAAKKPTAKRPASKKPVSKPRTPAKKAGKRKAGAKLPKTPSVIVELMPKAEKQAKPIFVGFDAPPRSYRPTIKTPPYLSEIFIFGSLAIGLALFFVV